MGLKMKKWGGILVLFILGLSHVSHAQDLSPIEIYSKCYSRISDFPVEINSSDYKKVAEGSLDPVSACENLLNKAMFERTGNTKKLKNENDVVAQSILRNFNQFHNSWFTSLSAGGTLEKAVYNFTDSTEPALFITDALFGSNHYKSIFTRTKPLRGIRRGKATSLYTIGRVEFRNRPIITGPFKRPGNNTDSDAWEALDFARVPTGYLVGVTEPPDKRVRLRYAYYEDTIEQSDWSSARDDETHVNLTENFGGGILGSQAYIMANSEANQRLDGGNRIHRRMANNTFSDLLCLTLPTLLNEDVGAYMKKYNKSDLSFRKDRSCARCHATLDPFAHTARNITPIITTANNYRDLIRKIDGFGNAIQMRPFRRYKVRTNQQSTADSDTAYIRRAPQGHLYYRDYDGNLIDETVTGLNNLGQKLTQQNDPYVCAAQRYYKFLTGITVPVANKTGTPFYMKHREEVVELGLSLKKHGSLKRLILDILKSPAFQTRNPSLDLKQGVE